MEAREMLNILDRLLEDVKVAVLSNIGEDGSPVIRWMSPALVRGREGFLYAVTSPKFPKTAALKKNPKVMWMIQSKALDEVINIKGTMQVLENPSLKSMVIEAIGGKLQVFWSMNPDESELVVLETEIESIDYAKPTAKVRARAKLS